MQETIQQIVAALPVAFSFFAVGFSIWSTIRDRQATRYKSDSDAAAAVSDAATKQMQAAWGQVDALRSRTRECEHELETLKAEVHTLENIIHEAVGYIHSLRAIIKSVIPHASVPDEPPALVRWRSRDG